VNKNLEKALADWGVGVAMTIAGADAFRAGDDLLVTGVLNELLRAQTPGKKN